MNRQSRRANPPSALAVAGVDQPQGGLVSATLQYGEVGQPTMLMVQPNQFVQPERTFAADCAVSRCRLDSPELQFVQLDPYDETKIFRSVLVRFDRHRFVERARHQAPVLAALHAEIDAKKWHYKANHLSELMASAKPRPDHVAIMLDAELEMATWLGGKAAVVFVSVPQNELASALNTKAGKVMLRPELEITLPNGALVDLLVSWKATAEGMDP